MQRYDVFFQDKKVGDAFVTDEGLYKRIRCKCNLPDASIWRLYVLTGNNKTDIGICVPNEDFVINKRISLRQLSDEILRFIIESNAKYNDCQSYFISDNMPFPQITKLGQARFLTENGKPMIILV